MWQQCFDQSGGDPGHEEGAEGELRVALQCPPLGQQARLPESPNRDINRDIGRGVAVPRVIHIIWREKKPIKKNHIKEFSGRMPRRRPRDKLGTSQGHLGCPDLCLIYV